MTSDADVLAKTWIVEVFDDTLFCCFYNRGLQDFLTVKCTLVTVDFTMLK